APSRRIASGYPPGVGGSAPGVATTSPGRLGTSSSLAAALPLILTGTPANARPSSSAVRLAPTPRARRVVASQCGHVRAPPALVHHEHSGGGEDSRRRGPWHHVQRAVLRQEAQASPGVWPVLGTWNRTGARSRASWTRRHARLGIRAWPTAPSRWR